MSAACHQSHLHLVCLALLVRSAFAVDSDSTDLLYSKIYNENHAYVPPPKIKGMLNVTLDIAIYQLQDVNEKQQTLSIMTLLRMTWTDSRLAWRGRVFDNGTTFNSIKAIKIVFSHIWKPDIIVHNEIYQRDFGLSLDFATLMSDGSISLHAPMPVKMTCQFNVRHFPYDRHECPMRIGSWTLDRSFIQLRNISSHADVTKFEANEEFCLVGAPLVIRTTSHAVHSEPFDEFHYTIVLQRKPLYYELNMILPGVAILIVALFNFRLPPESGERLTLSMTIMFTLIVFMELVGERTPIQSDVVPLLTRYFASAMVMASLCVLGNVVTMRLHLNGKDLHRMGWRTEACVRLLCRLVCYSDFDRTDDFAGRGSDREVTGLRDDVTSLDADVAGDSQTPQPPPLTTPTLLLPPAVADGVRRVEAALSDVRGALALFRELHRSRRRWEDAARALDRLLFCCSLLSFCGLSLAVLVIGRLEAVRLPEPYPAR